MNLFQRLRESLGLGEDYDELEDYDEEEDVEQSPYAEGVGVPSRKAANSKVVGLPGLMMEMVLMQPRAFDEVSQAVTALRERKSVILNLSLMDAEQAQRSADYVAGGAFAIDGHQRQLGPNIFLFTPSSVQISNYPTVDPALTQQAFAPSSAPPMPSWPSSPPQRF